jgi:cytochrome P450
MSVITKVEEMEMPTLDYADPEVARNPQEVARRLLAEGHWIVRTPFGYALLDWEDCKAVDRDGRFRTPEGLGVPAMGITEGKAYEWASRTVLGLDGADHDRIRRLAQPGFAPRRLDELRPSAEELFDEILGESLDKRQAEAADLCMSYSVRMICRLLGWTEEDWRDILAWAMNAVEVVNPTITDEELRGIEADLNAMRAYTSKHLERLRAEGTDGFAMAILRAEEEGDRLSTDEVLDLFETLLVGGSDTTKAALTNGLYLFATHPDQFDALVADPELATSAVEEVLRFRPPNFGTIRVSREPVVIRDVEFPAGCMVSGLHPAANFDTAVYDEPQLFDITRYTGEGRVPKPNHLSFGFGVHVCIGNYLARIELQVAFRLLAERVRNLHIDESDPRGVEWGNAFGIQSPAWLPLAWDLP